MSWLLAFEAAVELLLGVAQELVQEREQVLGQALVRVQGDQ